MSNSIDDSKCTITLRKTALFTTSTVFRTFLLCGAFSISSVRRSVCHRRPSVYLCSSSETIVGGLRRPHRIFIAAGGRLLKTGAKLLLSDSPETTPLDAQDEGSDRCIANAFRVATPTGSWAAEPMPRFYLRRLERQNTEWGVVTT